MDCPLKFYYIYVAELSAPEQVSAEIDSATFGSIFHLAAENIYKDLTAHNNVIDKETLEALLHNEVKLQDYVDVAFKELFFNVSQDEKPEYNGVQLINSAVISRYLKQLLENDLRYTPFTFVGSEQPVQEDIEIKTPKGIIKSRIGGIIDRLDSKDGTLRIVDYKTGGDADTPPNVESSSRRLKTLQLCVPNISLCCHYVSETAIKGRSFLALYSSGSDRNLLSGYSNGRIS